MQSNREGGREGRRKGNRYKESRDRTYAVRIDCTFVLLSSPLHAGSAVFGTTFS